MGKGSKSGILFQWLEKNPHLNSSGELVNRATLQQICLGVGIITGDAHFIQFSEDEEFRPVPDHISTSPWGGTEYGKVHAYIHQLQEDVSSAAESLKYAVSLSIGSKF
jgi:hypothetical protein